MDRGTHKGEREADGHLRQRSSRRLGQRPDRPSLSSGKRLTPTALDMRQGRSALQRCNALRSSSIQAQNACLHPISVLTRLLVRSNPCSSFDLATRCDRVLGPPPRSPARSWGGQHDPLHCASLHSTSLLSRRLAEQGRAGQMMEGLSWDMWSIARGSYNDHPG